MSVSGGFKSELSTLEFKQFFQSKILSTLLERDKNIIFSHQLWKKIAETGFYHQILNNSMSVNSIVKNFSSLAENSLDIPLSVSMIAHLIGIDILYTYGNKEQQDTNLLNALNGETIMAVANSEMHCGTDITNISSKITLDEKNKYHCSVRKNCSTNLGEADIVFSCAWDVDSAKKPFMEVLMLQKSEMVQTTLVEQLSGFHTGMTGSLTIDDLLINDHHFIGKRRRGFKVLGHCYNIERIGIGAIMMGILNYCRKLSMYLVKDKKSFGKPLIEHQYVQDKIISIYTAHTRLSGLMNNILIEDNTITTKSLVHYQKELAMLKIAVIEEGNIALQNLFELSGAIAYSKHHIIQKLLRDFQALTFLGGSKEQQKITFIDTLKKEYKKYDIPKVVK